MVHDKKARIAQGYATSLSRVQGGKPLIKYSLIKRGPTAVQRHLNAKPWAQLNPDELQLVLDEYYGITRNATPSEQATPVFRIAGTFVTQINKELLMKQDLDVVRQASQLARAKPDPKSTAKRRKKVKASGLSKKPTKTRKPRKKRSKRKEKTPKAAEKDKTPPKTALQKWHKQKKNPGKMRL